MSGPSWDSTEYHIDCIADELARKDPGFEAKKAEIKASVAKAIGSVKSESRQNRSSADKYPMAPVRVNDNPTGAKRGKK